MAAETPTQPLRGMVDNNPAWTEVGTGRFRGFWPDFSSAFRGQTLHLKREDWGGRELVSKKQSSSSDESRLQWPLPSPPLPLPLPGLPQGWMSYGGPVSVRLPKYTAHRDAGPPLAPPPLRLKGTLGGCPNLAGGNPSESPQGERAASRARWWKGIPSDQCTLRANILTPTPAKMPFF